MNQRMIDEHSNQLTRRIDHRPTYICTLARTNQQSSILYAVCIGVFI